MNEPSIPTFWVKPALAGNVVRDPDTMQTLPEDGAEKPANSYWLRRIKDKDVVEVEAKSKKLAMAKNPPKAGE